MKQRLLVIDDEPQICELLNLYLTRQGYDVATCSTSSDALRFLAAAPTDLVVLDIGLAHEDGLQVLERIKQLHPKLSVVMLTGMGFVEDLLEEAHQKGADGYVSKVLPLEELLAAIQRTLRSEGLLASG